VKKDKNKCRKTMPTMGKEVINLGNRKAIQERKDHNTCLPQ
jgi:hypothetical protein